MRRRRRRRSGASWPRPSRSCRDTYSRGGRCQLGIHVLQSVLDVREFLVELAQTRLQIGDVVREPLHLRAHGVKTRPGSRREVLRILLDRGHAHAELVDRVQ